ncbi:MAG: hypothetical protein WD894_03610 [Pirellulales bacterium]
MTTKLADSKGRIVLGSKFANKTVIIEEIDELEVRIIAAAVIPERELWLHKNEQAMATVQQGLAQARSRRFSKKPPNLKAHKKLAGEIDV